MLFTRREFLRTGASVVAAGSAVPAMLLNMASARAAENDKATAGRVLVVLELNGGNDGLNTLAPVKDPAYIAARPTLAIAPDAALMLDERVGLHPSMTAMAEMFKTRQLAVIQGAGYPNANRSHFRSMEIWHRGDPSSAVTTGWLGRWYERGGGAGQINSPVPLVHYGKNRPEIFKSGRTPALSINAIDDFYPMDQRPESMAIASLYAQHPTTAPADGGGGTILTPQEVIQATGTDIVRGTEIIRGILKNPRAPKADYPRSRLAQGLAVFSQMIVQNIGTKLFYISQGGFDTHARQGASHGDLLGTVSAALGAFMADLKAEGRDKDVLVMAFSEFGRRVKENGSAGTDHGAASVMFFAGGTVKGGLYGQYPALTDLSDGDLKFNVDFRDCYASVLEDWLATDPTRVLGRHTGRCRIL